MGSLAGREPTASIWERNPERKDGQGGGGMAWQVLISRGGGRRIGRVAAITGSAVLLAGAAAGGKRRLGIQRRHVTA